MRSRMVEALNGWLGGGFLVPDYAMTIALAIVAGIYLGVRRGQARSLDPWSVYAVALAAVVAALLGARLHFAATHPELFSGRVWEALQFWRNGLTSTGAFLGGLLGLAAAARWQRLALAPLLDSVAPATALAIALGRLGCFLNGCCHGSICQLPWAARFPAGSGPYAAQLAAGRIAPGQLPLPVHPTQLYEAALALTLCGALLALDRRRPPPGALFAILFTVYPAGRFLNELLRGDSPTSFLGLTVAQAASLVALTFAGLFWLFGRPRERRR